MFDPKIKVFKPTWRSHDLSYSTRVTINFGRGVPVLCKHLTSGMKYIVDKSHYLKFEAMLAPAFQKYDVRFDAFIIPEDVHWKDSIKFYPQTNTSFNRTKEVIPYCTINPVVLYGMVAFDQLYYHRPTDDVLNPFTNSLIDSFNLPTFDNFLDRLRSVPDSTLVVWLNAYFGLSSEDDGFFTEERLNWNYNNFFAVVNTDTMAGVNYFMQIPFFSSKKHTVRNTWLRSLFLGGLLGYFKIDFSQLVVADQLSKPVAFSRGGCMSPLLGLTDKKAPSFYPFLAYQSLWREYYRNGQVDEDDSGNLFGAYLPKDFDYEEDILPYIGVSFSDFASHTLELRTSNLLSEINATDLEVFYFAEDAITNQPDVWKIFQELADDPSSHDGGNFLDTLRAIHNLVGTFDVNYVNDYFTSASINALAENNVQLPLGMLPVVGSNLSESSAAAGLQYGVSNGRLGISNDSYSPGSGNIRAVNGPDTGTIPELRIANIMQVMEERAALASAGRDYEWYKLFLGHIISDARLHRPVFLNRSKSTINIQEVTQTGMSSEGQPLGDVAGKASSVDSGHLFSVTADEPSWVMVIMSVVPRPCYFQGFPVEMTKTDSLDFLVPLLQHVGMRSIDTSELFVDVDVDGTQAKAEALNVPFGFTDLYNEYRCSLDEVHGEFRNSMSYWTSVRTLKDIPRLNPDFIKVNGDDPDLYRPFAVANGFTSHIVGEIYFNIKADVQLDVYPSYSL